MSTSTYTQVRVNRGQSVHSALTDETGVIYGTRCQSEGVYGFQTNYRKTSEAVNCKKCLKYAESKGEAAAQHTEREEQLAEFRDRRATQKRLEAEMWQRAADELKAKKAAEAQAPVKVAIVSDGHGNHRVHNADCRDVEREVTRFRNGPAYVQTFADRGELAEDWWGDVAGDEHEEGSQEWKQECRDNALSMVYLPCCTLPEEGFTSLSVSTMVDADSNTQPEENEMAAKNTPKTAIEAEPIPVEETEEPLAGGDTEPTDERETAVRRVLAKSWKAEWSKLNDTQQTAVVADFIHAEDNDPEFGVTAYRKNIGTGNLGDYASVLVSQAERGVTAETIQAELDLADEGRELEQDVEEPYGYMSASGLAHTAKCASVKAAEAGKLNIPMGKQYQVSLAELVRKVEDEGVKECRLCAKLRATEEAARVDVAKFAKFIADMVKAKPADAPLAKTFSGFKVTMSTTGSGLYGIDVRGPIAGQWSRRKDVDKKQLARVAKELVAEVTSK